MRIGGPRLVRGLLFQVFLWTAVPLLAIAIVSLVSIYGHQQAVNNLMADEVARLARVTASDLSDRLADRTRLLQTLAEAESIHLGDRAAEQETIDQATALRGPFDQGIALIRTSGEVVARSNEGGAWLGERSAGALAARVDSAKKPAFAPAYSAPTQAQNVTLLAVPVAGGLVLVGGFSADSLAVAQMLADLQIGQRGLGYVVDGQGRIVYHPQAAMIGRDAGGLPGVAAARSGRAGALFAHGTGGEQLAVGYAPVPAAGWSVVVSEPPGDVVSPMMQFSVISPALVILAALVSLAAVYLTLRYVIRPLQILDRIASRIAWGDFAAADTPVGGAQEVKDLHATLRQMAAKIQSYQAGMESYVAAVTQGQEEERRRLARELHDDTAQALVGLIQRIKLTRRDLDRDPQRAAQRLDELASLATTTWQEVRQFSEDLRPPYLEQFGLEPALSLLAEQTQARGGPEVSVSVTGPARRLAPDVETAIYRIVQEALNNVRQHAHAQHAWVELAFGDGNATAAVADDGVGFQPPEPSDGLGQQGHFGLAGMRERAVLIGGQMSIDSAPGRGTRITVSVPDRSGNE